MGLLLGVVVLFFALIVVSVLIVGLLLASMLGLYRKGGKSFEGLPYGDFDFGNFQKGPFQELVIKLSATIAIPIIVLPMLEYLIFQTWGLRAHYILICIVLFLLETAAFVCGFHFLMKIDRLHTITLTAIASILYLLIYWLYLYGLLST